MTVEISARVRAEFYYYADSAHVHKVGESRESLMTELRINVLGGIRGDSPDDCALTHLELDDVFFEVDFGDLFPEFDDYEE
jgi:hypothetical protein